MLLFALIILSALVAYRGMQAGAYFVIDRCLMGALAIAAGASLAGPLCDLIPTEYPYLNSICLFVIALAVYLFQRVLADLFIPERQLALPAVVDRIGGMVMGFLGGMMGLSFLALVLAKLPPETWNARLLDELVHAADFAVRTIRLVGLFAGTDEWILLSTIAA